LSHPNIAATYGLEESASSLSGQPAVHALVLELVEGPTLADRIALGPVPLEEALSIAKQIADALEAPTSKASFTATSSPPTSSCAETEW
jgi:serine/threonine-protein kinase